MELAILEPFWDSVWWTEVDHIRGADGYDLRNSLPGRRRESIGTGGKNSADQFIGQFALLVSDLTDNHPLGGGNIDLAHDEIRDDRSSSQEFDLALFADKDHYRVDDLVVFTVQTEVDCFLTLVNVDTKGTSTVILPNRFRPDPVRVRAGRRFDFPSEVDGFQFRLADRGIERLIALCSTTHERIPGIDYHLGSATFAGQGSERSMNFSLGDATDATTRQIRVEAAGTGRKKPAGGESKVLVQARRAISFEVR